MSWTSTLPFLVFLVQASYVKLIFHPISSHRLSHVVCICALSPSDPSKEGSQGRVGVSSRWIKKQSAAPPLWDPLFWSQLSCHKSEYFRQNTPTCLCLVLHTHARCCVCSNCRLHMDAISQFVQWNFPQERPMNHQQNVVIREVLLPRKWAQWRQYFQVVTCGHISQSTQYRLQQQGPDLTLGSRELP